MNNTINNILKYSIITGLAIIVFIPLYVADGFFFPFITGKAFAFRIIVEIIFSLWLVLILRERGTSIANTEKSVIPRLNSMTWVITIFTAIAFIADVFGLNPLRSIWSNSERMEGFLTILHLWAYFMVMSSVLRTREVWYKFFNVTIIAGLITALYGLFQFFGWTATHQGGRIDASLGNSAYMAVYMLINAFLSMFIAISNTSKKVLFWLYSFFAVFFSFIMFQTATRGTILGWLLAIICSALIYTIFGKAKKFRFISGSIVLFVIIIGFSFYNFKDANWIKNNNVLGRLATISISDTKTQARRFVWPMAIKGVFENPKSAIIGVGQENFNYIFNSHYDPKMWKHEQWFDRAHSVFLDWLVAGGLIGLISYLSLYLIALVYIYKSDITVAQKSILIGLLVGYGVHNVFVFDNQISYIMFFIFLAFIHSLRPGKVIYGFKNYTKTVSEDMITVRDYIFVPIIVIAFACAFYFINVRTIQANTRLIDSMRACSSTTTVSVKPFLSALELDQTMLNQEIVEQLINCSINVIQNQQISEKTKIDFYSVTKNAIEKQIKTTPDDARIYIIAGTYYNVIKDFESAMPLVEKAAALSPNKQSIMYELATTYLNTGKSKEALVVMEKAYMLDIENFDAKVGYASTLINIREEAKAEKLFASDPKVFEDSRTLSAYSSIKHYDKVIEIYKKLIKDNPGNEENYSALGYTYLLAGRNWEAIGLLKQMGEKFPLLKTQADTVIKQIQSGQFKLQ